MLCSRVLVRSTVAAAILASGACVPVPASYQHAPVAASDSIRASVSQAGRPAETAGRHEYVSNGSIDDATVANATAAGQAWWSAANALEGLQRLRPQILLDGHSPTRVILNGKLCESQDCLRSVSTKSISGVFLLSAQFTQYRYGVWARAIEVTTR